MKFLDDEIKMHLLSRLEKYIKHAETGEDFEGRDLKFDLPLAPYCHNINKLDGVVTRESCVGHRNNDYAYISLCMSNERFWSIEHIFNVNIKSLLDKGIERPGYIFRQDVPGTNYSIDADTRGRYKGEIWPTVIFRVKDKDWTKALDDIIERLK